MSTHEWVEVKARRWCLGCQAFQTAPWPLKASECPRDTPYVAEYQKHVDRCNRATDREIEENERRSRLASRWAYLDSLDEPSSPQPQTAE